MNLFEVEGGRMRRFALAACLLASAVPAAVAKDFQLPKTTPIVAADMPDDWGPVLDDEYLIGSVSLPLDDQSPSFQAKILWFAKEEGERQLNNTIRNLKIAGDEFDLSTAKNQADQTINGMKFTSTRYEGKDPKGKPLMLMFGILETSKGPNLRITMEASPKGETAFASEFSTFVQSIKPL